MYKLQQQMAPLGIRAARHIFQVAEGVEIDVDIAGDQITAVIRTGGGTKRPKWFEDFVLFAGQAAFVGEEIVYLPVILSHAPSTPNNWVPYFRSVDAPGYAQAPSPKGTYFEVFPARGQESDEYLPGGQVTHVNERGEAVSYYGMAHNQYMWMPYRVPTELYMGAVFHMGHILFDVSRYDTETNPGFLGNTQRVISAAIRDGFLYVMFGEHVYNITYTVPPAPTQRHQAWGSPVYPGYPLGYQLVRFPLKVVREEPSGMMRYKLSSAPAQRLWSGQLTCALNAWVFDKAVRNVVSYSLPENPLLIFGEDAVVQQMPQSTNRRFQLSISADGSSASFGTSPAGTRIAEDDGNVLHLEQVGLDWQYRHGPNVYPAFEWRAEGGWRACAIYYANLRTGHFVFSDMTYDRSGDNFATVRRMMAYHRGVAEEWQYQQVVHPIPRPELFAERADLLINVFDGMTASAFYWVRMFGFTVDVVERDGEGEIIERRFQYELGGDMLGNPFVTNEPNVSFGGGFVSTSDADSGWTWNLKIGYGPNGSAEPYTPDRPETYIVVAGAFALEDPVRFAFGATPLGVAVPGGRIPDGGAINRITDANLSYITGGVVGQGDRTPLSINILGKPPVGQPLEYPSGD